MLMETSERWGQWMGLTISSLFSGGVSGERAIFDL
jgi:hypothetical protein